MSAASAPGSAVAFRHDAYVYDGPDQFARDMTAFILDGLRSEEAVAVAETPGNIDLLVEHLGDDAEHVEFLDMVAIGLNPARILSVWDEFVARSVSAGRGMRGIGEPAWPGRRPSELAECRVHEMLLNTAFDPGPPWWLVCPYDAAGLPPETVTTALHTHPTRWEAGRCHDNPGYDTDTAGQVLAERLPSPPADALRFEYDAGSLGGLRSVIDGYAAANGIPAERRDSLVLACWEVGVNSVVHAAGGGMLRLWREPGALGCQLDDAGYIADPLVGRRTPDDERSGGRGVYLANHLCDLVQVRSSAEGTSVRMMTWL